jgi:glycosyltransferase involved in cell wall biosynthesis
VRILLVNSFYYVRGGDCLHMLGLQSRIVDRGHKVAVFTMRHPENLSSAWSEYWVENVEFSGRLSLGHRIMALPRTAYSPAAARAFEMLVADFKPDVVHFHSIHHHLTTSPVLRARKMGLPSVWTLHDYRLVCPATHLLRDSKPCTLCSGGRFFKALGRSCKSGSVSRTAAAVFESHFSRMRGVPRSVDCFIAPSRFLAETCRSMELPAKRFAVLPNPVDGRGGLPMSNPHVDVVYVGRLSPEKGVDTLLRAAGKGACGSLLIVGDGPDRARLESLSADLGLAAEFTGWLSRDGVLSATAGSRLLAVPSVWYENCPGVVLEAMQTGTLVVASDIGGLRELLDDGRCGYLAKPGDVEDWRRVLETALRDQAAARRMTAAASARIRERHSWEGYLDRLESLYEEVIAAKGC